MATIGEDPGQTGLTSHKALILSNLKSHAIHHLRELPEIFEDYMISRLYSSEAIAIR